MSYEKSLGLIPNMSNDDEHIFQRTVLQYSSWLLVMHLAESWVAPYKQAWTFSPKPDSSPMSLDWGEGERLCQTAVEEWIRAVLDG
jgi:hypothetical protein